MLIPVCEIIMESSVLFFDYHLHRFFFSLSWWEVEILFYWKKILHTLSVTCCSLLFRLTWCSRKCDLTVARGERGVLENLGNKIHSKLLNSLALSLVINNTCKKVIRDNTLECSNCPPTAQKTDNSFLGHAASWCSALWW